MQQNHKLSFFNSLTRSLEEFVPLKVNAVSLYTCGPTVYDSSHIGHARSCIVWDCLVRFMQLLGYSVEWARNITDIDDKIINRSRQMGILPEQLARAETFKFWQDMRDLNVQWPTFEPRATENLPQMFSFIQGLLDKDFAYKADNGDIYFNVFKFNNYGQLKKMAAQDEVLARVEHLNCKQHDCDFALWKACQPDDCGFESPFGFGRPGWHLECSAMIKNHFGETIDIHGGGEDLLFPHHENEIAQSEALHGKQFARYWLHNGMIMVDGKKMSKSEGNFITIRESLQKFSGNTIRFFVLSAHYRQPLNYTEQALEAAQTGLARLLKPLERHKLEQPIQTSELDSESLHKFNEAMCQDLNTANALALSFDLAKRINKGESSLEPTLRYLLKALGFNLTENTHQSSNLPNQQPLINFLTELRQKARDEKNFALSDQIRACLESAGFTVMDLPGKTQVIPSNQTC